MNIQMGADIVVTGRTADSALALAPLMHEFKWGPRDFDRLAAGSLAGHLIECGGQATGGLFTDFDKVDGYDNLGFPIVEVESSGDLVGQCQAKFSKLGQFRLHQNFSQFGRFY